MLKITFHLLLVYIFVQLSYSFELSSQIGKTDGTELKSGDSIRCDFEKISEVENRVQNVEITPATEEYTVYDISKLPVKDKCISFAVRSKGQVTITFFNANQTKLMESLIGVYWPETQITNSRFVYVSRTYRTQRESTHFQTENILSENNFHHFWLRWTNNRIEAGKFGADKPFMYFEDINDLMFDFKYFGLRSAKNKGYWILLEPNCPQNEAAKEISLKKCHKIETETPLPRSVRLQELLLKQMTLDLDIFKKVPENWKTSCFKERNLEDLKDNYAKAKQYNEAILLEVIKNDDYLEKFNADKTFSNIKVIYLEHLSLLSCDSD